MIDLRSLELPALEKLCNEFNIPKFRAKQLFSWLHKIGVQSFDEMSNIPKNLKEKLQEQYYISTCEIERKLESQIDDTVKYLFKLHDGEFIESVVMKYKHGWSICVSTQVGCAMGCKFCASTKGGRKRNLTSGEIANQIYVAGRDLNIRISNIVLMGMGEPLDNYDNVMIFLRLISSENGVNIGMRHISLSTCGVVPKMHELEKENLQLTLSVSLHAPTDEIRSQMMPVNDRWGISEVINACKSYIAKTNRRISFEYSVVQGVNDSDECALKLASLLKGMLCHVNLIPVNTIKEGGFVRPDKQRIKQFENILLSKGINTTIRRTLGSDISASCGQLRGEKIN